MLIEIESGLVAHDAICRVERTETGCNIFLHGEGDRPFPSRLTVEQIFARLPIGDAIGADLRAHEDDDSRL